MHVSLVVPIKNEEASLERLLRSIEAQTHPPDEVILVDGGSTDHTVALARGYAHTHPFVRVLEAGPATPGRGRNVGIEAAQCDWIALTDAGIVVTPTWLEALVAASARRPEARVVYGNYEPVVESRFTEWAALAYVPPKFSCPEGRIRGRSVASMLLHRDAWRAAGGFPDYRAAEDLIFMERLNKVATVTWAPTATAWWSIPSTPRKTFSRFYTYSAHNVWANRQAQWHYGVAKQYALVLGSLLLGLAHSVAWLLLIPLWMLARVGKTL